MSAITGIVTAGNGQEMYAGRVKAYDGLGQSVGMIPAADYMKMVNAANLNFEFHYSPVFDDLGNEIPKSRAVFREVQGGKNDGKRIHSGIVGARHHQTQPVALAEAAAAANPDGHFETAGLLKNSRMWIQMTGDTEFVLDPNGVNDRVLNYFTVTSTFDGSGSIMFGDTDMRWNCQNVITSDVRGTKWEMKVRHTQSSTERIALAVQAMAAKRARRVVVQETYSELFATPFSTKQYENAVTTLHGTRPDDNVKGRLTKWENMMDSHMWAWNADHNAGIKETAWGAWQAILERSQWFRNVQDTPDGKANFYAAGAGFDGPTNALRRDSLVLIGQRAGVKV